MHESLLKPNLSLTFFSSFFLSCIKKNKVFHLERARGETEEKWKISAGRMLHIRKDERGFPSISLTHSMFRKRSRCTGEHKKSPFSTLYFLTQFHLLSEQVVVVVLFIHYTTAAAARTNNKTTTLLRRRLRDERDRGLSLNKKRPRESSCSFS